MPRMQSPCQWNSDAAIEVIYFFGARPSQAEHTIGFKAAGQILLILATKRTVCDFSG
jgi:hypothetical protein